VVRAVFTGRFTGLGFDLGLALYLPRASVSLVFMVIHVFVFCYILYVKSSPKWPVCVKCDVKPCYTILYLFDLASDHSCCKPSTTVVLLPCCLKQTLHRSHSSYSLLPA